MKYIQCDQGGRHQVCDVCGGIGLPLEHLNAPMGTRDSRVENYACQTCTRKIWDRLDSIEKLQGLIDVYGQ